MLNFQGKKTAMISHTIVLQSQGYHETNKEEKLKQLTADSRIKQLDFTVFASLFQGEAKWNEEW